MTPAGADRADRGQADPALRAALAASGVDAEHYLAAIEALCGARLLLPIMAVGAGDQRLDGLERIEPDHPERETPEVVTTELVAVILTTPDGRRGLPAFTGLDAFTGWRPDARPLTQRLDEVAKAAIEHSADAILVDLAGPAPLVIEPEVFVQFAAGRRLVRLEEGGWGWLYAADSPSADPAS